MSSPPPGNRPNSRQKPRVRLLSVGKFFGVPLYFAPSWLVIAALLTFYYGPVVQDAVPGVSASSAYLVAFGYAVLFALCVLAHELGHTAVSLLLKRPVKRIVIFLLGGISEIEREPDRPRDEFLIAAAGPLVSIVVTGIAGVAYDALDAHTLAGTLALLLFWSNLVVVIFNLMPGLPLDGGRVLRAIVWAVSKSQLTGTRAGAVVGRVVAALVFVLSLVANRGPDGIVAGLVGVMLAAYLWFGAGQSLKYAEVMARLPAVDLETLLRPGLLVRPDLSIAEALRRMWQGSARGLVLIDSADRPAAIVEEARVNAVPPDRRPWVQLSAVARPLEAGLVLRRGLKGEDLLAAVRATPASEYLVVDDSGAPAGILATADLAAALGAAR
ncbi:MAG TPA: site-2 protease family protein [Jatrophihabitantaceae bacterium]|nr:site-2 protease family protein [Jatrophihabitantaceae bacterium]